MTETDHIPEGPLDPHVLAKVSGLKFRVKKIVEGFIAGLHKSPYHGFSVEFAQHRQYNPGDDIRYIDWKVFGRSDRFFIKEYEEETNMTASVLVDCSESMNYSSGGLSKYDYGACIAGTLAYLLLNQQDSVGITLFDSSVRTEIHPSTNPGILKNIMDVLEQAQPRGETKIEGVFLKLLSSLKRNGVVILVSDFFVDPESLDTALKHFSSRGHTVFLFHVLDRAELEFPFNSLTLFRGMENEEDLMLDPNTVKKAYLNEIEAFLRDLRKTAVQKGVYYYLMDTSKPLGIVLSSILSIHGGRRKA